MKRLNVIFLCVLLIVAGAFTQAAQAEEEDDAIICVPPLDDPKACVPPPPPPPASCNLQFWGWAFTEKYVGELGGIVVWEVYGNANGAGGCDRAVSSITVEMTVETAGGAAGQRDELCGDVTLITRNVSSCHVDTANNFWFNQPFATVAEGHQACFTGELTGQFYYGVGGVPATSMACHTP